MSKKVVIVGGGFAGINMVQSLGNHPDFQITIVDQNNYHFFPPLIYQVATSFIQASNITYPIRKYIVAYSNVSFHMGKLLSVKSEQNLVETDTGALEYDFLILALGTETNFFGLDNVKRCALPMKSIEEALYLRAYAGRGS